MALQILKDEYVNSLVTFLIALIPFFTIGFLGMNEVLYVTVGIGILIFIGCIARMIYCIKSYRVNASIPVLKIMVSNYSLSYMFLLSYFIMKIKGIEVEISLWFSVAVFLLATPMTIKDLIKLKNT